MLTGVDFFSVYIFIFRINIFSHVIIYTYILYYFALLCKIKLLYFKGKHGFE